MRNRLAILTIALAAAVAGAVLALSISLTVAQAPATSRATRTPDGKPNLNGIWQALNEANWDIEAHGAGASPFPQLLGALLAQPPGQGVVEGGPLPYTPEALARKKENFEKRLTRPTSRELNETAGIRRPSVICLACRAPPTCRFPFRSYRLHSRSSSPTSSRTLFARSTSAGSRRHPPNRGWAGRLADGRARRWLSTSPIRWPGHGTTEPELPRDA